MRIKIHTPLLTAILSLLVLGGCAAAPEDDGRECLDVSGDIVSRIADGANDAPITPSQAAAVRSHAFEDATIVAMDFTTQDGSQETGVWAVLGQLDDPGSILAVDAVAAVVTDWPNQVNGEQLDITEDGAAEAMDCLRK